MANSRAMSAISPLILVLILSILCSSYVSSIIRLLDPIFLMEVLGLSIFYSSNSIGNEAYGLFLSLSSCPFLIFYKSSLTF